MTTALQAARAPQRHVLLGTGVDAVTLAGALAWIDAAIARRRPVYVVTLNGAMLVQAAGDAALRTLVNGAGLVTADGVGVLLAARILGVRLAQRVAGIDLMLALCERAAETGWRIFLLGAAPGVAATAAEALRARFPGLQIAGVWHGFFTPADELAVLEAIRRASPDVLVVGMGAPRQEEWIGRWHGALGVPVSIGVGGSLDVIAGRLPRAPRWMQRLGLEWLYRAVREPRRWQVVRTIPRLFWLAVRERWRHR
ncbi:MAG: WecB/TagA/CpsF family glycosyltransferase [Armatimonadota bacterium]|nr:WecB/TagA/CpsF family glycosyltransferase [Armatimonadota bacterium]MDR7533570.1 WecB/TagA/CpsF family glycosyltransferase [Armatimonadota bacterium]MDR7537370.1 WecB/TagA/CpsF family glycosyltransferase [Armatimonadota bacterium]